MTTQPSGQWITHEQAASILGCHVSNVPKLSQGGVNPDEEIIPPQPAIAGSR